MSKDNEKLYSLDEFAKEFGKDWTVKKGQYVLVENKGTFAERTLSAYDTELEAFKIRKRSSTNISVIKADVRYVTLEGITFLYDYEPIE